MTEITPFDPSVPQSEVDRLFRKLNDTRIPDEPVVPDAGEDYGPPLPWVHKLYKEFTTNYDWSKAQSKIKKWSHYTTNVESLRVHFIHEKAKKNTSNAIPIILVHGWPGSFYEFSRVIDPLTNPEKDGDLSFHVVVPSLPGFCWSQGPPKGWTLQDTARIFDTLMKRLGYSSYVAQGGDWGHWVVREMGARFHDSCKSLLTNMCPSTPPVPRSEWTEREKIAQDMTDWWLEDHMGYAVEMRTRPHTIGIAFMDNPIGIMMFYGEKYHELVDPKYHDLSNPEFVDDVLTTVSLYYFTPPSVMTAMLCYYNNVRHEVYAEFNQKEENLIKAPFGFTSFRWDITPTSKRSAGHTGNCQWFREREYGGHFAALEVPNELVEDIRDCFKDLYKP